MNSSSVPSLKAVSLVPPERKKSSAVSGIQERI